MSRFLNTHVMQARSKSGIHKLKVDPLLFLTNKTIQC